MNTDALRAAVAKLEAIAKKRLRDKRGEPCNCHCHENPSLIHVGPVCCERAVNE